MTELYPKMDCSPFTVEWDMENTYKSLCEICRIVNEWGVVVITGVFTREYCQQFATFAAEQGNIILPHIRGKKPGRCQNFICNAPQLWKLRNDLERTGIWQMLYEYFSGYKGPLLSSVDAMTIHDEATHSDYPPKKAVDWAHSDEINTSLAKTSFQGQVVFSDSYGKFVASPKSHKIIREIIEIMQISEKSAWCFIGDASKSPALATKIAAIKTKLATIEGSAWQGIIDAPIGSVIIWPSTTIHAARVAPPPIVPCSDKISRENLEKLDQWRIVSYVCFTPAASYSQGEYDKRHETMRRNLSTNHTGKVPVDDTAEMAESLKKHSCPDTVRGWALDPTTHPCFNPAVIEEQIARERAAWDMYCEQSSSLLQTPEVAQHRVPIGSVVVKEKKRR